MANPGLIKQTTLEAATEGVQVITKAFEREIMEDAGQLGWFVDVTNDTFPFMRTDREFKGFVFGAGGNDTWDMGLKRLGTELMGMRNYPADDDQVDFRVRELQASRVPHANVEAWGATGDGSTDDRSAIVSAFTEIKTEGGGEVFLPAGRFRLSTSISLSDLKGITIRGAGITATTLVLDNVTLNMFTFTACEAITFRDISFEGAGSTTATTTGGLNFVLGSKSFHDSMRFENVRFNKMSNTPVTMPNARQLYMSNVAIDDVDADMVVLDGALEVVIDSLIMTNGQQRGLYMTGGGSGIVVNGSKAASCGIGFEVDNTEVLFNACVADEGVNRSATYPGYGFVSGHTDSTLTLVNTRVLSTAGITPYVENTGSLFCKVNAVKIIAGVTTTESVSVGNQAFFGGAAAAQPTVTGSRGGNAALAGLLTGLAGLNLIVDSSS